MGSAVLKAPESDERAAGILGDPARIGEKDGTGWLAT
jgi:hypothetical protein